MKKSKIINLSLGIIAVSATIITTPLLITSCKNNEDQTGNGDQGSSNGNENGSGGGNTGGSNGGNTSETTSIILRDQFLSFNNPGNAKPSEGTSIEKTQDTNNWNYHVGEQTIAKEQLGCVYPDFKKSITMKQYISLGFGLKRVSASITYLKDGKDTLLQGGETLLVAFNDSADKTKPQKIEFKFVIFDGTWDNIIKKVEIPFSLTMIPGIKQQQK